jgi:spore maturation protein CgeB
MAMHILTILCRGGWMPANISEGWRRLGCHVEEFFYGTHMGKDWSNLGLEANRQINLKLLETAKRLKAENRLDLIFAMIYDDVLDLETARQLRSLDVPMVNYHVDLVGQWYRILRTGKFFDRIACAQKDHWQGLSRAGLRPYYMPMAANPPIPEIENLASNHPFDGVLYLGSPWLYRRQILTDLSKQDIPLQIYGHNWLRQTPDPANAQPRAKNLHDLRHYLLPRLQVEGWERIWQAIQKRFQPPSLPTDSNTASLAKYVKGSYAREDFGQLVKGAAINLGFTHFLGTPNTASERRQIRLREFEIPMHGGFYLTQDCLELQELFGNGKYMATWDNLSDLKEKIFYYLNHPTERQNLTQATQTYCLQNHTWEMRFKGLLKDLNL